MAIESTEASLSEGVGMYLDRIRAAFADLGETWLLAARETSEPPPWRLLIFGSGAALESVRGARDRWYRDDVELLIVTGQQEFASAWDEAVTGDLAAWHWGSDGTNRASYVLPGRAARLTAVRVR